MRYHNSRESCPGRNSLRSFSKSLTKRSSRNRRCFSTVDQSLRSSSIAALSYEPLVEGKKKEARRVKRREKRGRAEGEWGGLGRECGKVGGNEEKECKYGNGKTKERKKER